MRVNFTRFWVCATLALALALPVSAQRFTFQQVDCTGEGIIGTGLTGISDNGIAVGVYLTSDFKFHGLIWAGGACQSLDREGVYSMVPMAVNNRGQIVGYFYLTAEEQAANREHAFLLDGGVFTELVPTGPTSSETQANGISNSGVIVGSRTLPGGSGRGFILKPDGTWIFPDGPYAPSVDSGFEFLDVNEAGWIVGMASVSPAPGTDEVAFVRSPTGAYEIVRYDIKPKTELTGLNAARVMVGRFYDRATDEPPWLGAGFLRDRAGNLTPLSFPATNVTNTHPMKITSSGWIAGMWVESGTVLHGFIAKSESLLP